MNSDKGGRGGTEATNLSHNVLELVDVLVLLALHDGDLLAELARGAARHLGVLGRRRGHRIKPAGCANIAICTSSIVA